MSEDTPVADTDGLNPEDHFTTLPEEEEVTKEAVIEEKSVDTMDSPFIGEDPKVPETVDEDAVIAKATPKSDSVVEVAPGPGIVEVSTAKSLGNTCVDGCKKNVPDVVMFGEDLFKLLSKASSKAEGWMKSTKAMNAGSGAVVQVTTQQKNPDGSYSVAEAVTYVPNCSVTSRGDGYYLKANV